MESVIVQDLGKIEYEEAWNYQTQIHKQLIAEKLERRHWSEEDRAEAKAGHHFLFCEHPPVYTLGKSGSTEHLLLNEKGLQDKGIGFFKINRGGDITFHGPGQIVGYPIFDLDEFFNDVHQYVRYIEEAVIRTLAEYGLEGKRIKGYTGVWLEANDQQPKRKICAIGVHLSRWVSLHGFAFNINTDLRYFDYIIPCGINDKDKMVTSLAEELGKELDVEIVKKQLLKHYSDLFGIKWVEQMPGNTGT